MTKHTWAAEFRKEYSLPRGQIIRGQSTITVPENIGDGHEDTVTTPVNSEPKRRIPGQVNLLDDHRFLEDRSGGAVVVVEGDGNLAHAAVEKGDEESTALIVPLGALAEPPGAVVLDNMGGRPPAGLKVNDNRDGNGGDDEEE